MRKICIHLGFIITGIYLLETGVNGWSRGKVLLHYEVKSLCIAIFLFGCVLIILGTSTYPIQRLKYMILLGFLIGTVTQYYIIATIENPSYTTDSIAFSHYAARLTIEGKNPYKYSMLPALSEFNVPSTFVTSHLDGSIEERVNYPVLNFFIYIPFILCNVQDMRIVTLLFHIGVYLLLYRTAPSPLQPLVAFPLLIDASLIYYTASGATGMTWAFFMVLTAILWKRERLRAVTYSAACLIKPTPWALAPFLLIRIWKEAEQLSFKGKLGKIVTFSLIFGGVFFLCNFIFIWDDPQSWFAGVFAPLHAPMLMAGQGLSTLTQTGFWVQPKSFYSLCSFSILFVLLIAYACNFDRMKHTVWCYPGIILWCSYRSLGHYFVYWTPMLMISVYSLYTEHVKHLKTNTR